MADARVVDLAAGDYRLQLEPERGGSIATFTWRGLDVFRRSRPGSILETGCFPLVPFSNRIRDGRFVHEGQPVTIAPNMPDVPGNPNPLHGFGWCSTWDVAQADARSATIIHDYPGGEWRWPYRATQRAMLGADGLRLELSVQNLGDRAMPAGLGFHPYFPLDPDTIYFGLHHAEWHNDSDCLPRRLECRTEPTDWWQAQPVHTRSVDTVYQDRAGPLRITWPSRGFVCSIEPDDALSMTVVYVPPTGGFFCIEPVSHATNAHNSLRPDNGLVELAPRETLSVGCLFAAKVIIDS